MAALAFYPLYLYFCLLFINRVYTLLFLNFFCLPAIVLAQPVIPEFRTFKPVSATQSYSLPATKFGLAGQPNSLLNRDSYQEQNFQIMQQAGMDIPGSPDKSRQAQIQAVKESLQEKSRISSQSVNAAFQKNYQQLLQLNPDKFSITRAVYLVESAYEPALPSYKVFWAAIENCAVLTKQILEREGLDSSNNTAVIYAIQKLWQQSNKYYDVKSKRNSTVPPLRYDFQDPMGEKDWRKMFVSKVLQTGTGQCHSFPLLFLCVAEQLNAKAYLSLAPNHSFVQYFDEQGNRYNFECTNGSLVTQTWLMQSTYINTTALKNRTYLDTLCSRELYAACLSDLLLGYIMKVGYDGFSDEITEKILEFAPSNITALMTRANYFVYVFRDQLSAAGNPPKDRLANYPKAYAAYKDMLEAQSKVIETGFQEMPEDAYQRWLQTVEQEKERRQNKQERQRLQREITRLKNMKNNIINTIKE